MSQRLRNRSSSALIIALLVAAGVAGCMPWAPPLSSPDPQFATLTTAPPGPSPYVLGPGDDIALRFYTNPELNEDVQVRPDGMISVQLIGDVPAAGLTPTQLNAELTRRYTGELANPQITAIVRRSSSQRVYVGGEVGAQGVIRLTGGMTLFQAIQKAGGFTKTAHRKDVVLIRRGPDGKPTGRTIDVREIQTGAHPENDLALQPFDVVFVPRSKIANVDVFVEQYIRNALPISYLPVPTF